MTKDVNNEISNLFQELIVSKIKVLIDEIDERLIKSNADNELGFDNILRTLPKNSTIKSIVKTEADSSKEEILDVLKNMKTEKYVLDIVMFLKKQYQFEDGCELCKFLENSSHLLNDKADATIADQKAVLSGQKELLDAINVFSEKLITSIDDGDVKLIEAFHRELSLLGKTSQRLETKIDDSLLLNKSVDLKLQELLQTLSKSNDEILNDQHAGNEMLITKLHEIELLTCCLKKYDSNYQVLVDGIDGILSHLMGNKKELGALQDDYIKLCEKYEALETSMDSDRKDLKRRITILTVGNIAAVLGMVFCVIIGLVM